MVDLPVLGLQLDLTLRVFSNLNDAMIQNGIFQNPSLLYYTPKIFFFVKVEKLIHSYKTEP